MREDQSTIAVDYSRDLAGIASYLSDNPWTVVLFVILPFVGFMANKAAGAIIGEYTKEAFFSRFRTERRKLKEAVDRLEAAQEVQRKEIECACQIIADLQDENERLLRRAIQAEQLLRTPNTVRTRQSEYLNGLRGIIDRALGRNYRPD